LGNLKERDNLKKIGVYRSIILKSILRNRRREDVEWIHLVHDCLQWLDLVNTFMNFGFNKTLGNCWPSERLLAPQGSAACL